MSGSSYVSEPPEGEEPFIINKKIFHGLKKFGWSLVPRKRYVSLHFYMDRAEEINPDIKNDVENPSHVLIFAMQLLNGNVFQPLGSIFFRKSTPVEIISSCIKGYIKDLSMCELTVINTLCPASNYLREVVEDLIGVENLQNKTEAYVYNVDSAKLTHIYDPPTMLSEVKREFMNSSIMFTQYYSQYEAYYEDIKKVIKYRSNDDIENAMQLFSFDTKSKIRKKIFKGEIKNDGSAEICAFFNILFDTFNGESSSNNTNRMPLTENSVHKDVWKNALTVLKSMKCVKNSTETETKIQHSKDRKASGTKNLIKKETKIPKCINFEDTKEMNDIVDKVEEAVNMVANDINKIDLVSLKYYENMPTTSNSEDNITNHQQLTEENIKKDLTENHKKIPENICNPNVGNNSCMDAVDKQQCVPTKMKKKKWKKNKRTAKMNASVPDDSKSNKTVAENVNINVGNQIVNEENVANLHNDEYMKSHSENKLNTIYEEDNSMNFLDCFKSYDPTELMEKENNFSFLENILKSTGNDDTTKKLSKQKMYSDYAVMLFNQKHKDKKKENSSAVNILSDSDDTHNIKNEKFEIDSYDIEYQDLQAKEKYEDKLILETVKPSDSINVLSNDMQNKCEITRKDNIRTSAAIPNEIEKNCQNCSNKCSENGNCYLVKVPNKNKKSKKNEISQICLLHETEKTIEDQFSNFESANGVSIENQDLAKCNENQNKLLPIANILSNDMQNKSEITRKDNIGTSDAIPKEIEKNCQNYSNTCSENGNCYLVKVPKKNKKSKKNKISQICLLHETEKTIEDQFSNFESDNGVSIENQDLAKCNENQNKLLPIANILSNDMQNKSEITRKDNIRTSDAIPKEIEKNCQNYSNTCSENGNCYLVKVPKKNKKSKKNKISQICLLHETKKTIEDPFSNFESANGVLIENQDLAKCNENQNKLPNVNEETVNSLNELECTSLPSGCTVVSSETINCKTNGNEQLYDTKIETVQNEHNEICQLTNVDSSETINSKTNGNEQLYDTKIETVQNEQNEICQLTNVDINNKSNDVTLISPLWKINKKEKNISEIIPTKELKSDTNITYKKPNSVDETIVFFNETLGNHLHETLKNVSKDACKQNIDIQNISTSRKEVPAVDSNNIINKMENIIENPFRNTIKNTSKSSKGSKQINDIPNAEQKEKHFLQTTQNMCNDIDRKESTVCHSKNIMMQIAQKIDSANCDKQVQQNDSDILGNIAKKTENKLECLCKDCGIKKNIDEKIQEENFNKLDQIQNKIDFAITPNEFRNCMVVKSDVDIFGNGMNEKNENVSTVKFSLNEKLPVENQDIKTGSIKENRIEEISNVLMPHTSIDGDGELNCKEKEDLITKSNNNSGTNSNTETISDNEDYTMEVDNVIEEDLESTEDDDIENGFRPYVLDAWIITINGMKEIFNDMCNKRFDSVNTMQYNLNTLRCLVAELQKVNYIPNAETNTNFTPQFVDYDLFQIFLSPEASITLK